MKKVLVIGAGMVGTAIAADLSRSFNVVVADRSKDALARLAQRYGLKTCELDGTDQNAFRSLIEPFELVVSAVPGHIGFETLRSIIEAGKDVVDISFFPEDPFLLDDLAREKNVTAIVDCGVAPGLCNIIAGYHSTTMKLDSYECLVGGLPVERTYPHEYKAVFSPSDVIEEYLRPARFVENNELIVKEALTDIENVNIPGIGTLESFNTDGLRTLAFTLNGVADMKEKTLRYPGHVEFMRKLRASGFFSKKSVEANGMRFVPLEVTSAMLFAQWKYNEGDADFTIMRVELVGREKGVRTNYTYHLLDRFDQESGFSSMARTTGFTCTAAVQLLAAGEYTEKGIAPPEYIGMDELRFRKVLSHLAERKVVLKVEKSLAHDRNKKNAVL